MASQHTIARALKELVEHSHPFKGHGDVSKGIHGLASTLVHDAVPELEEFAAKHHVGNFVAVRGGGGRFFESMPAYVRLGMHLAFCGREQVELLEGSTHVEHFLREMSEHEGRIYDTPESVRNIPSFVHTYDVDLTELLEPDPAAYASFNAFFFRRLKPGARPVERAADPAAFCAAADCRLVVYPTVALAQTFWIKGDEFSVPALLGLPAADPLCRALDGGALALFRLAPADYHRFHSPADGAVVGAHRDLPGQYYTVNPQAVRQKNLDVFTRNRRSVLVLEHALSKRPIAIVAVGALMVGSIVWTYPREVKRGDELGYFAYGGSTVVALFPPDLIEFDQDLLDNSRGESPAAAGEGSIETLMKVGFSLGTMPAV